MKQATTVLIAVGALLAGGIATAAFMNNRNAQPEPVVAPATAPEPTPELAADDAPAADADQVELEAAPVLQYAQIVKVDPVTQRERLYATVIGTEPVRETTHTTVPKEVCEDVVVQERLPEKDGNVGGTVAGAVIGGLLGNQVGGGSGKKAATAAGAIAGGVIGNKVDKDKERGQVVTRTMLLEIVWDYHFDPQTNVIDVHMSRLRAKIDKGQDVVLLHTIRGAGYMIREPAREPGRAVLR